MSLSGCILVTADPVSLAWSHIQAMLVTLKINLNLNYTQLPEFKAEKLTCKTKFFFSFLLNYIAMSWCYN